MPNLPALRCFRLYATVTLLTCCLLLLIAPLAHSESEQQVHQRMQQLQSDISNLQTWLNDAQAKTSTLQQQLRASEQKINRLRIVIRDNLAATAHANTRMQKLQDQASHLQDGLSEQEQQLSHQLKRQYQQGTNAFGSLLLNLDNPAAAARNMAYFQYLNQASAEQMAAYRQTLNAMAQVQQQQADITLELQQQAYLLSRQQHDLDKANTKLSTNLRQLQNSKTTKAQRLASAKADQQQAQLLLDQIQEAIAKANIQPQHTPFSQAKGKLPWPLKGKVLNRFGVSQSNYPLSQQGWLISAPEGSDVYAVHSGHVVFSDWLKGYGLVIILDHGDDFLSLYGQNQTLYLSVGDPVTAQQLIASSGKSGGNTQAGVYFSLRKYGKPLNPKHWVR